VDEPAPVKRGDGPREAEGNLDAGALREGGVSVEALPEDPVEHERAAAVVEANERMRADDVRMADAAQGAILREQLGVSVRGRGDLERQRPAEPRMGTRIDRRLGARTERLTEAERAAGQELRQPRTSISIGRRHIDGPT